MSSVDQSTAPAPAPTSSAGQVGVSSVPPRRAHRPRRGIWIFPNASATDLVDAAVAAEEAGLDEFWLGDEGVAREPFAILAAAATRTSRITLGIAVTNPFLRHATSTAAAAMTVDELSAGRVVLGLGPGGTTALGPARVAARLPLTTTRDALRTIRATVRGEASEHYAPTSSPYTRPRLPIYVGSRGERFQRLASAEADGAFIGGIPVPALDTALGWARSVRDIPVSIYSRAAFDEPTTEHLRGRLILPLADSPAYVLDALGLAPDAVGLAATAYRAGDASAARAIVSDEVLDSILLAGEPDDVAARLADRVQRFAPASVGLSFGGEDLPNCLELAAATFAALDRRLAGIPQEGRA